MRGIAHALFCVAILFSSCGERKHAAFTPEERGEAGGIVRTARSIDAPAALQKQMENESDRQMQQTGEARLKPEQECSERNVVGYGILASVAALLACLAGTLFYIQRIRLRSHRALLQASSLRENFFTNITHELRTPLTVILGLSRDLQRDVTVSTRTKAKVETIERQGNSLLTLINQLLDISKIKSAADSPDWRNGDIGIYIEMIIETYRDYARNRNIDLQYLSKEAMEMDFAPDYVNKLMNNLLSNALKFTPEYGKVSVMTWREGERWLMDVSDTGAGIGPEALAHIFEPFYQAGENAHNVGSDVGLALVKQIVDAIGGKITVESAKGKGTTFHLSLPVRNEGKRRMSDEALPPQPLPPEVAPAPRDSEDGACRLLVIEDNRDLATYIGELFARRYAVFYAADGKEGLERARELIPDLIITDLMMPGIDGLELCRKIRADENLNHIPLIMVTAKVTEEERIKGLKAGADAYLAKPFNSEELCTRVDKLLESRRMLRDKFTQSSSTNATGTLKGRDDRPSTAIPGNPDHEFLAGIARYVYHQTDNGRKVDVPSIASHLHMSHSLFYRKLFALTGLTPQGYILRVRVQRAQQMIDEAPNPVYGEIADRCGFNDYSTFVRAFRNIYGITPSEYKKR